MAHDCTITLRDRTASAILDRLPGNGTTLPDWEAAATRLRNEIPGFTRFTDDDWMALARNTYSQGDDGLLRPDWDPMLLRPLQNDRGEGVDLWPIFRALGRVPVAALRGGNSELLTDETLRRMAEEMPGMTPVTVPDIGHAPGLGEPESRAATDAIIARV